jgi:hypothetical protein
VLFRSVTITCTQGDPGNTIKIPGTNCDGVTTTIDASGNATCTGTAGLGATNVHNDPPVTVTDPVTKWSSSGVVPLQITGTTSAPKLPVCSASPNPAGATTSVTITCTGGTPGDTLEIPDSSCTPAVTVPASGSVTCTGIGGELGSNPPVTVKDPSNNENHGTVPLIVDATAPAAPVCSASPNPAGPTQSVTIACAVDVGTITTIPGAICPATVATTTTITCTGTGAALGNNPPATSTDALGNSRTRPVPLQIVQSPSTPLPPRVPVCTASPNPADPGAAVTINCVNGDPGNTIKIPGTSCDGSTTTINASGTATCTGTAGSGATDVHNDPPVTVTDPVTQQSNSGTVPLQINGTQSVPRLPVCSASPNPAGAGTLVTITCTGGTPGDTLEIPRSSCTPPVTIPASGNVTCTGIGSELGSNPPVTVKDPANNENRGTVPLNVDSSAPNPPQCTANPNLASAAQSVTITCTVDVGTITAIPGAICPATAATTTTIVCTGKAGDLGNNPPATSTDARGNSSTQLVPLQLTGAVVPKLPACTANPNPQAAGGTVVITCTGGTPGDLITIPGTDCAATVIPAGGTSTCTGTAGTGAGEVNNNPPVTVKNPGSGLSSSGVVPFALQGTTPTTVTPLPLIDLTKAVPTLSQWALMLLALLLAASALSYRYRPGTRRD